VGNIITNTKKSGNAAFFNAFWILYYLTSQGLFRLSQCKFMGFIIKDDYKCFEWDTGKPRGKEVF